VLISKFPFTRWKLKKIEELQGERGVAYMDRTPPRTSAENKVEQRKR
jgi:hypothetical protein